MFMSLTKVSMYTDIISSIAISQLAMDSLESNPKNA